LYLMEVFVTVVPSSIELRVAHKTRLYRFAEHANLLKGNHLGGNR